MTTEPKFAKTFCSQCGGEFGPGDSGYSHCSDHMTNPYTDKAADLVTKLFRTGEHINGTVIWEPTEMVATALQEAADEALERAAGVSDEHATFCEREAYNGGSNDLFERARGAEHLAEKIRALKSTPPKGEE